MLGRSNNTRTTTNHPRTRNPRTGNATNYDPQKPNYPTRLPKPKNEPQRPSTPSPHHQNNPHNNHPPPSHPTSRRNNHPRHAQPHPTPIHHHHSRTKQHHLPMDQTRRKEINAPHQRKNQPMGQTPRTLAPHPSRTSIANHPRIDHQKNRTIK